MEKFKFEKIIEQFRNSITCLDGYQAISDFMQAVFDMKNFEEFNTLVEKEHKKICEKKEDMRINKKYYTNKQREQINKALNNINTNFFLSNLYRVYFGLMPENIDYGVEFLFYNTSPNEPMSDNDKNSYLYYMKKVYQKTLPFLEDNDEKGKKSTDKKTLKKLKITEKITWEDIEIEFKDDFSVKIKIKNRQYESDYEKMGFADNRKNSQDETKAIKSWDLLKVFSIIKNNEFEYGKLSSQDERDKFKKNKQKLSQLLKEYFQIDEEPIIYDKERKIYKTRIKIIPEKDSQEEQWQDNNIYEQIK